MYSILVKKNIFKNTHFSTKNMILYMIIRCLNKIKFSLNDVYFSLTVFFANFIIYSRRVFVLLRPTIKYNMFNNFINKQKTIH